MKIFIKDFLEQSGYDTNTVDHDTWEDLEAQWEEECEQYCYDAIQRNKQLILLEWSYKANIKKRNRIE